MSFVAVKLELHSEKTHQKQERKHKHANMDWERAYMLLEIVSSL